MTKLTPYATCFVFAGMVGFARAFATGNGKQMALSLLFTAVSMAITVVSLWPAILTFIKG